MTDGDLLMTYEQVSLEDLFNKNEKVIQLGGSLIVFGGHGGIRVNKQLHAVTKLYKDGTTQIEFKLYKDKKVHLRFATIKEAIEAYNKL